MTRLAVDSRFHELKMIDFPFRLLLVVTDVGDGG